MDEACRAFDYKGEGHIKNKDIRAVLDFDDEYSEEEKQELVQFLRYFFKDIYSFIEDFHKFRLSRKLLVYFLKLLWGLFQPISYECLSQ